MKRFFIKIREMYNKSMLNKLVISFIVVLLIPLFTISFFSYSRLLESTKANFIEENTAILKALDISLQMYFEEFERLTYNAFVSQDIQAILMGIDTSAFDILENQWKFDRFVNNLIGDRRDIEGVYLVLNDGKVYHRAQYGDLKVDYDIRQEDWFEYIERSRGEFLILGSHNQRFKERTGNEYVITVGRKLSNLRDVHNINKTGVFFIEIMPDIFYRLAGELNESDKNLIVVDSDGMIIYDKDRINVTKNIIDVYNEISYSDNIASLNDNSQEQQLVSMYSKSLGWTLIINVPEHSLISNIEEITRPLLLFSILFFSLFLFLSFYFAQSIVQPVKTLKSAMTKVQKGDFTQKVEIQCGGEIEDLALSFNIMVGKIDELIISVYQAELKTLEANFKALQAEINPHFLYNALDSISNMAVLKRNDEVCNMIEALARMFRYSIKQSGKFVTLDDEINHVKDYVLLQTVDFDTRFEVKYDIPEQLRQAKVLKLILQPLVENAIIHSMEKIKSKGEVVLAAVKKDTGKEDGGARLYVYVRDNGAGIKKGVLKEINDRLNMDIGNYLESERESDSIGLINIHSRVRLNFGADYGLSVNSESGQGTELMITLPYITTGQQEVIFDV